MASSNNASGSARSTTSNEKSAESASTVPTSNLSAAQLTKVVKLMDEKIQMMHSNMTSLKNDYDTFKHLVLPNFDWTLSSSSKPSAHLKSAASNDVIDLTKGFDAAYVRVCHQKSVASVMDHEGPNGVYARCFKPSYLKDISGGLNSTVGRDSVATINKAVAYLTATLLTSDPGTKGYVYPEPLDLDNEVVKMHWNNVYPEISAGSYILTEVGYKEDQVNADFFVVGYKTDETFTATAVSFNEKGLERTMVAPAKSKLIEAFKSMDCLRVKDKAVEVHVLDKGWLSAIPFEIMGPIGTVGEHALESFFPKILSSMKSTWIRAYVNVCFLLCLTSEKENQFNELYESLRSRIEAGGKMTTALHLFYVLFLEATKLQLASVAVDIESIDDNVSIGFNNPLSLEKMIDVMQSLVDDCEANDSSPSRSPTKKPRLIESHADSASRELGKPK